MTTTTDRNQRLLIMGLPFFFVPFIINFPAGLLVYWITTNLWTVGQGFVVRRLAPHPATQQAGAAGAAGAGGLPGPARAAAPDRRRRPQDREEDGASAERPQRAAPPPPPRKKKKRSGRRR